MRHNLCRPHFEDSTHRVPDISTSLVHVILEVHQFLHRTSRDIAGVSTISPDMGYQ